MNNIVEHKLENFYRMLASYRDLKREENRKLLCFRDSLSNYSQYKAHRIEAVMVRNKKVISSYKVLKEQQKKLNRSKGHLFNPLFLMSIGETKHSELLGYLLKPWETHGYGHEFLFSFLCMLGIADPQLGKWQITVEKGRIDILLRRASPASVVIIENKSNNATDQQHQLYRYWYKAIHEPHQIPLGDYTKDEIKSHFKIIYLPSGDHKIPAIQSLRCPEDLKLRNPSLPNKVPLGYDLVTFNRNIADWLEDLLVLIEPKNTRLRTYLAFYQELCRSL